MFRQMEKLIELLNEYAHTYADHYDDTGEEITIEFYSHTDECFQYACDGSYETLVDDVVISKRYGFIKWLVENDKIDLDKAKILESGNRAELFEFIDRADYMKIRNRSYFSEYKQLLMLLSIQDEPINFLISILK